MHSKPHRQVRLLVVLASYVPETGDIQAPTRAMSLLPCPLNGVGGLGPGVDSASIVREVRAAVRACSAGNRLPALWPTR